MGEEHVPDAERDALRDEPERGRDAPPEAECWDAESRDVGAFPPGPEDFDEWIAVLPGHPHLAPALEPGFQCLVDGTPVVVDESRADQLRCCGNGVVPLQAAAALVELVRRID